MQKPLFKFLVVGFGATFVNYSVYWGLYIFLMVKYEFAYVIGFLTGVAFGYLFNRTWSFKVMTSSHRHELWRYVCVYCVSLLLGLAVLEIAVQLIGFDPLLANFITIGVTTIVNYTGVRYWVFR